jgi:hypothetical protein
MGLVPIPKKWTLCLVQVWFLKNKNLGSNSENQTWFQVTWFETYGYLLINP